MIRVQTRDFDIGAEIAALRGARTDIGAIVTFTGTVRDRAGDRPPDAFCLEPGELARGLPGFATLHQHEQDGRALCLGERMP